MRRTCVCLAVVAVVILASPAQARADMFVQPFVAFNGGETTRESAAFGVSGGWMGRWFGGEGEVGWSPSFFDDDGGFRVKHSGASYTATGLVGPRVGAVRPYGAFGVGALRSRIEEAGALLAVTDTRAAMNVGGGLMWDRGSAALRVDARYIRAFDEAEPEANVFPESFANLSFWRIRRRGCLPMVSSRATVSIAAGALFIAGGVFLWTQFVDALFVTPRGAQADTRVVSTSRAALDDTISRLRKQVAGSPENGEAAVLLADALMRAARVQSDSSLPLEAEQALKVTLQHGKDYAARRMLAVVYLSQHRFSEALELANEAQTDRPQDAWNYATAGDALVELGRYDEAFDMFDQAIARRPDAGAYARVAYAKELQGDLGGALHVMAMAAEATAPQDVEARAWVRTQLGLLHLHRGELADARREFAHAEFLFPDHPYALTGRIRLAIARSDYDGALQLLQRVPATPESLAMRGDLLAARGETAAAEAVYLESERLERQGWQSEQPQPGALARFLAERDRNIPEAVRLAERAAKERADIHTMDALAWWYFKAGRVADASAAIRRATRTGTVDHRIRCHAAVIAEAGLYRSERDLPSARRSRAERVTAYTASMPLPRRGRRVFELAALVVARRRAEAIELAEVLHAFGGLPHPDQRVAKRVARLWVRRIQRDRAAQGAFRGVKPLRGKMNPADGANRRGVLAAEEQRHEEFRQGLVIAPDTEEGEPEILVSLGFVRQQPRALRQRADDAFVVLMAVRELGNSPVDRGLPGDEGSGTTSSSVERASRPRFCRS